MKTKHIICLAAFLAVLVWHSAGATVKVTNLHLEKNTQYTELTIECDGPCAFTHEIVEATANKPHRIVVDVKDAVQALPERLFDNLPPGSIKQIRTSQYAIAPEKIVRVVLDVGGALTYKAEENDNSLVLHVNTPSDKNFPRWSAVPKDASVGTRVEAAAPKGMPMRPERETSVARTDQNAFKNEDPQVTKKPTDQPGVRSETAKPSDQVSATDKTHVTQAAAAQASKPAPSKAVASGVPPAVPGDEKAAVMQPPAGDPKLIERIYGISGNQPGPPLAQARAASPTPSQKTEASPESQAPSALKKHADSVVSPQSKPGTVTPSTEPYEMTKPPKAEKSGLPDTKINKSSKYTEESKPTNAPLSGTVATTTKATADSPGVTGVEAENPNVVGQDTAANVLKSKSEAVRQKYLAGKGQGKQGGMPGGDTTLIAADSAVAKPLTAIERIRLKYKRGIRFVQNDEEETQIEQPESEFTDESEPPAGTVGPYSEFLPEREIVVYVSGGRPDPFEPLIEDATATTQGGQIPDVETLRLVGVLQDRKGSRALFQDYNGYSYILKTGDRVKNGFVLSIEETRVLFQIRQYGWNRQVAIDLDNGK